MAALVFVTDEAVALPLLVEDDALVPEDEAELEPLEVEAELELEVPAEADELPLVELADPLAVVLVLELELPEFAAVLAVALGVADTAGAAD